MDQYSGPVNGTVIRFDYTFDEQGLREYGRKIKRRYYTYTALWIEGQGKWYVTGIGSGLSREYAHSALMALLSSGKVRRAQVATEFDTFMA